MGRQGGIARFTGTVGDINCYFDYGMELMRRKPRISKEKWRTSASFKQQRACAKVFGASSVIAAALWKDLPAGMRRLADGSAYGRLVGAVRELTETDGQLWDAELLAGLDLSYDSMSAHWIVPGGGDASNSYKLIGLDALMADLDAALGGAAGTMASTYVIAHPFWNDGYTHEEPMSEWRGGDTTNSEKANRIRKPIGWKRGKHDKVELPRVPGVWGAKHDGSGNLCGPLPIPEGFKPPQRRVRVWVHATEVCETKWRQNGKKGRFVFTDDARRFSNGFVTDWVTGQSFGGPDQSLRNGSRQAHSPKTATWAAEYLISGRDWRTEWMGDGIYVVYTATEVQEKRGRHWVRLPWCCKMQVQEVVTLENGVANTDPGMLLQGRYLSPEQLASKQAMQSTLPKPSMGQVGYRDEKGEIVIVEGWPEVGRDIQVWTLEDLLPNGRLVAIERVEGENFDNSKAFEPSEVHVAVDEANALETRDLGKFFSHPSYTTGIDLVTDATLIDWKISQAHIAAAAMRGNQQMRAGP